MKTSEPLRLLKAWTLKLESVYEQIARQINTLVILLNEASGSKTDLQTKTLASHILRVLKNFEESEIDEMALARKTLSPKKAGQFLASLHQQLEGIKKLENFISLARRSPLPKVILEINNLSQRIKEEILRGEEKLS